MEQKEPLKGVNILSIDGGGILGLAVVSQLIEYEKITGQNIHDQFHFFTGTSTGSIIAALLAIGKTPQEIQDLYVIHGPKIFEKRFMRWGLVRPKYNDKYFNKVLSEYLGDIAIEDITGCHLLIPSFDQTDNKLVCWTNYDNPPMFKQKTPLFDIVRASSSAQTFFKPHKIYDHYHIDGGNVLNNPSKEAFLDALDLGYDKVNLLSFSTGDKEYPLSDKQARGGIFQLAKLTVSTILREQAQRVDDDMRRTYQKYSLGVYQRINTHLIHASDIIDLATNKNLKDLIIDGRYSADVNSELFGMFSVHSDTTNACHYHNVCRTLINR